MADEIKGGSQPAPVAPAGNSVVEETDLTDMVLNALGPRFGIQPSAPATPEPEPAEVVETPEGETPVETPPEETPAEVEAEGEQPDEKPIEGIPPEVQARIDKRLGKLTARAKTAEERVQSLEAENATLKQQATQPAAQPIPEHPLVEAKDIGAIEQHEGRLVAWIDQLQAAVDRAQDEGVAEIEDGERTFKVADVRAKIREYQRELNSVIPRAKQVVAQRQQSDAKTREIFPEVFDSTKPEFQAVEQILRNDPFMRRHPNGRFVAALIVEGQKALQARMKPAAQTPKKPVAPAKPAPRLPMNPSAGAPVTAPVPRSQARDWDVSGLVKAGGTREALVAQVGSLLG